MNAKYKRYSHTVNRRRIVNGRYVIGMVLFLVLGGFIKTVAE